MSQGHPFRLNIVYPMLFKLSNKKTSRTTHCGVLEFVADEGKIYIPYWMMQVRSKVMLIVFNRLLHLSEPDVGHRWPRHCGVRHPPCCHLLQVPTPLQGSVSSYRMLALHKILQNYLIWPDLGLPGPDQPQGCSRDEAEALCLSLQGGHRGYQLQ